MTKRAYHDPPKQDTRNTTKKRRIKRRRHKEHECIKLRFGLTAIVRYDRPEPGEKRARRRSTP